MANFVEFEEQLFAHNLQSAHLFGVLLLRQEHLAVATLANLSQDLEISVSKANSPLTEIGSLSTRILLPHLIISRCICLWGFRVFGLECIEAVLACANVG